MIRILIAILKELREIKKMLRIIASNTEQRKINFKVIEKSADSICLPNNFLKNEIEKELSNLAKACTDNTINKNI